jgi:hypothetical protein
MRRRVAVSHVLVMRTAVGLALCSLVACSSMLKTPEQADIKPWPEIRSDFRVETLRASLYEYSITFAAEVDFTASSIEQRTTDATIRRNALLWRIRAIPEMRKACFRMEPVSGLVDAWTLSLQMDQFFREGAGAGAFGTFQPEAVAVSRRLVEQLREIGGSIATSPEARAGFEHRIIDPWVAEHPLRDTTFVRESPVARFAEQSRTLGGVSQSVGTVEELAIAVSQQARIYLADLPRLLRGEADLMRLDIMTSQDLVSVQGDLHVTAAAAGRLASTGETLSALVENERRIVLDEGSRQVALAMKALSAERELAIDTIIRALASERGELLRDVASQRLLTLEWATAERREAIAQVGGELARAIATLRGERAIALDEVRGIVNMMLLRVALFLIAGVVLAPLVAHAYVRVWPRR